VLEWAQPAAVAGLVQQLGADVVEGQDLQEVSVKGSEVADEQTGKMIDRWTD
jgi:hypothetical protein